MKKYMSDISLARSDAIYQILETLRNVGRFCESLGAKSIRSQQTYKHKSY